MAYTDAATLAGDATFQSRVRAALHKKCISVGLGGWTDDVQKAHYQGLMTTIINNPTVYTTAFSWALAAYSGITSTSSDPDIDAAIDSLWPAVSGYIAAST